MSSKPTNVLLTLDDVRDWKRERERCAARIIELDKKLTAVAGFMPEDARIEVFGSAHIPGVPKPKDDRSTVYRFVYELLEREAREFSVAEVEGIVRNSEEVGEILAANPSFAHDALLAHARHGRVRKRGDLFSHRNVEPEQEKSSASGSDYGAAEYFREIVLVAAIKRPDGITTGELVSLIKADPRGKRKIEGNVQYPYSLLGRMVAKETMAKVGGRYYHPSHAPDDDSSADEEPAHVNGSEAQASNPSKGNSLFG